MTYRVHMTTMIMNCGCFVELQIPSDGVYKTHAMGKLSFKKGVGFYVDKEPVEDGDLIRFSPATALREVCVEDEIENPEN